MNNNRTILLVEDSDILRLQLMEILSRSDYEVLLASDMPSAVGHIAECDQIDLIVTDFRLPAIDGHSWLKFLAKFVYPSIKIGVISSYPIDPDGFPFLKKPFSSEAFLDFVNSTLDSELPARPAAL